MVEGAPVVHVSPASNARPPKTTSKASTTSKPLKPSAEPAVPPSSEEDRAKKAAIPSPSSKTPQKFTKNPGKSTKVASETPHDDPKLPRDVPKSTPTKSSKNSKAKSKDNMTTMNPPAVPGKRPEVASNTTKQIISDKKNEQPRSSNAPMSQKPKTESSVDKGNSAKVQGSPPTGEHIKPSKSKGNEKEKETSKYPPDNAPTKAADSPNSSSTTDSASKKEPTVAAKTSSPSPYFVPTRYSFAKDFAAPVPGCALLSFCYEFCTF
jgi:hypothetical protein